MEETISCQLINAFDRQLWEEWGSLAGLQGGCPSESIVDCDNQWQEKLKEFKSLPFIVAWVIWIARNVEIFEDICIPSFQSTSKYRLIIASYKCIPEISPQ